MGPASWDGDIGATRSRAGDVGDGGMRGMCRLHGLKAVKRGAAESAAQGRMCWPALPRLSEALFQSPPPARREGNSGLLHVCTRGSQHKAQKENWLVSVEGHRYLSVTGFLFKKRPVCPVVSKICTAPTDGP